MNTYFHNMIQDFLKKKISYEDKQASLVVYFALTPVNLGNNY